MEKAGKKERREVEKVENEQLKFSSGVCTLILCMYVCIPYSVQIFQLASDQYSCLIVVIKRKLGCFGIRYRQIVAKETMLEWKYMYMYQLNVCVCVCVCVPCTFSLYIFLS